MFNPEIAKQLRERFKLDVVSVLDEPELRGREDFEVLATAQQDRRLVVTEDVGDYRIIALDWQRSGRDHFGLIFTTESRFPRARPETTGRMIHALQNLASTEPIVPEPTNRDIWL